ncbi:MAG: SAM-dependent methyltransferase [Rhodospirillaceae bacterium]|nr:SAM-dependent methyltransferase [Rhodospirillaceae bacterium]
MSTKLQQSAGKITGAGTLYNRMLAGFGTLIFGFLLRRLMAGLEEGSIRFLLPYGRELECRASKTGPNAILHFSSYAGVFRLCFGGYMGLGEGYINSDWDTPSLRTLFKFGIANQEGLKSKLAGNIFAKILRKVLRYFQRNSKSGSRRNIAHHYDLGNAFYELWLDPSMTYSSALFDKTDVSLEDAQRAKYRRIVEKLDIQPHHRILEIGCGWGGFAEYIAETTGATVTGITISQEQHEYAVNRIVEAGLQDKANIELLDYREVTGQFDRIVSIEMLEAVGEEYWPDYFRILSESLAPDGEAMVQVIVVPDHRFENYRRKSDFIQRHIFPGGMLLSPGEIKKQTYSAGLNVEDTFHFGASYGETLDRWYDKFIENWAAVEGLGFDDRFRRLWEYYLNYTAAGFHAGTIDVGQFLFTKSR